MAGVAQLQVAIAGEDGAVARITGGHDAVKHVHAVGHALHQVFGGAHAHQVAWFVFGQTVRRMRHDFQHLVFGLAHAHAADGIAGEVHVYQGVERLLAKVGEHAALHDAKQSVGVFKAGKFVFAALRPAPAHFHALAGFGFGGEVAVGFVGRALVELHDDVAVEDGLNLHAHLGRHEEFVAVDGRGKRHALFGDLAHCAERPHLKTAAVGEDGFVPAFKTVQPAKALHDVEARAHPQMKGVAQDDLRAHFFEAAWHHAFDRAIGAHGHEDGGLHLAVVERERAATGVAGWVFFENVKLQHGGFFQTDFFSSSMASP